MITEAVRRVYPFCYQAYGIGADGRTKHRMVWQETEPHIAEDPQIRKLVVDEFRRITLEQSFGLALTQ